MNNPNKILYRALDIYNSNEPDCERQLLNLLKGVKDTSSILMTPPEQQHQRQVNNKKIGSTPSPYPMGGNAGGTNRMSSVEEMERSGLSSLMALSSTKSTNHGQPPTTQKRPQSFPPQQPNNPHTPSSIPIQNVPQYNSFTPSNYAFPGGSNPNIQNMNNSINSIKSKAKSAYASPPQKQQLPPPQLPTPVNTNSQYGLNNNSRQAPQIQQYQQPPFARNQEIAQRMQPQQPPLPMQMPRQQQMQSYLHPSSATTTTTSYNNSAFKNQDRGRSPNNKERKELKVKYGERQKDGDEEFQVEEDAEHSEGDDIIEEDVDDKPSKRKRAKSIHTLSFD